MKFCGVLNVDKPAGLTSREVVNRVEKLVRPAKAGHAGTLDPLATGVLVVCVGHATRLITLAQEGRKRYLGRFLLGQRSNTDDNTGVVTVGGDWTAITLEHVSSLLSEFIGRIQQVPPQFSAVHVQGRRAYDLARSGQIVELQARPVDVYSLRIVQFCPPELELEIECGSGTYVRSIGRDLGERLGCGALMTDLRRTSVGSFDVTTAVAPDKLCSESIGSFLQPALTVASHLPQRRLSIDEVIAVRRGQSIRPDAELLDPHHDLVQKVLSKPAISPTALVGIDGQLLGIGEFDSVKGRLQPRIVFPD